MRQVARLTDVIARLEAESAILASEANRDEIKQAVDLVAEIAEELLLDVKLVAEFKASLN